MPTRRRRWPPSARVLTHADLPRAGRTAGPARVLHADPAAGRRDPPSGRADRAGAGRHARGRRACRHAREARRGRGRVRPAPWRRPLRRGCARKSGYLFADVDFEHGDVDGALATADVSQRETYVQPSRHHNPMEPSATLAEWDGDNADRDRRHPVGLRRAHVMAAVLELAPEQIRVRSPHTGGGFGGKGFVWPHQIIAAGRRSDRAAPRARSCSRARRCTAIDRLPAAARADRGARGPR